MTFFNSLRIYLLATLCVTSNSFATSPNILFIAIDDLNDWVGYLSGHPQACTPNLDRLAEQGVHFTRAYCNAPSCNPSRASVLLGKHPNSTGFYSNHLPKKLAPKTGNRTIDLRHFYPDKLTLPQYFSQNGYSTFRAGKIFHFWGDWESMTIKKRDLSFDTHTYGGGKPTKSDKYLSGIDFSWSFTKKGAISYMDWGAIDAPYKNFGEYNRASVIIKEIDRAHDRPFFVALGFYLPHLPWYYPKKILDDPALSHIRNVNDVLLPLLPKSNEVSDIEDLPLIGQKIARGALKPRSVNHERSYSSWHDAITAEDKWQEAIQAYLASIYFMDLQLGRVLDALEASAHANNTIIVLWSDHGWMLGEKEAWRKYRPWEQSIQSNLIIKAPSLPACEINNPVELLSIWPTLTDLAGLPMKSDIDGRSLLPLIKNPSQSWDYPIITAHIDESGNGGWQSVRTDRFRYIKYLKTGDEELYDHHSDPNEWDNCAKIEEYSRVCKDFAAMIPQELTLIGSWKEASTLVNTSNLHSK